MSEQISTLLRNFVKERAGATCEYCQYPRKFAFFSFHIDHIISQKHGGVSEAENLAYSCPNCNGYKGSDIATMLLPDDRLVRLFNPRIDEWNQHFEWREFEIIAKTDIGQATIKILQLNSVNRIIERQIIKELSADN